MPGYGVTLTSAISYPACVVSLGSRRVWSVGVATPPYTGGGVPSPPFDVPTMFDYNGTLLFQGYDAAAAGGSSFHA